jgi:hypothetical protein
LHRQHYKKFTYLSSENNGFTRSEFLAHNFTNRLGLVVLVSEFESEGGKRQFGKRNKGRNTSAALSKRKLESCSNTVTVPLIWPFYDITNMKDDFEVNA